MNRKMEFIVEQRAQFVGDIHTLHQGHIELQNAQKEMTVKHNHLTEALTTVVGMVGRLSQGQERLSQTQEKLAAEVAESRRRADEKMTETNERLNIFINVLERYISERRNGTPPPAPE